MNFQDFISNLNWMMLLRAFLVGGAICVVGQILIDKTKLTRAILGGFGVYQYLVDFAGAGATVPLTGFGNLLAKGAIQKVQEQGILGAMIGGTAAAAGGITAAIFFGYIASLISKPKMKKQ